MITTTIAEGPFLSIQGEALHTGCPSIFIRLFGCSFTCPGFGMPKGEKTTEVDEIIKNIDKYEKYEDLPLVTTGCDSYPAVYPEFKHFSRIMSTDEVVKEIMELLPDNKWEDFHLVITGGEPLLRKNHDFLIELLENKDMLMLRSLTFETNGTQPISLELDDCLTMWNSMRDIQSIYGGLTFSVSPKLTCSGNSKKVAIKPEIVKSYQDIGTTYLKFVVANDEDVKEALVDIKRYKKAGFNGPIYLMAEGGTEEKHNLHKKEVAELALKHGLRYSDRLHISLFGNKWAT